MIILASSVVVMLERNFKIITKARAPEISRTLVKLAGSILDGCNARRQNTEFAANAINARLVIERSLIESVKLYFP